MKLHHMIHGTRIKGSMDDNRGLNWIQLHAIFWNIKREYQSMDKNNYACTKMVI